MSTSQHRKPADSKEPAHNWPRWYMITGISLLLMMVLLTWLTWHYQ